jgi:hypothetical protein
MADRRARTNRHSLDSYIHSAVAWRCRRPTRQSSWCFIGPALDILHALTEEAAEAALALKSRARSLEAELLDIEKRKAEIEAKLDAARRAQQRLFDYHPRMGRYFQCPRCWIQNEVRATLSPVPGTGEEDIMRCQTCNADWVIPLR